MKVEEKKLKIKLITPMLGTIPKDPEIYKTYIESKKPQSKPSLRMSPSSSIRCRESYIPCACNRYG